jgi:hypothetical protein
MRKLLLLTCAALMALGGAAKADVVYTSQLNIDHCTGTCGPAGTTFATLTLTDTAAGMTFSINPTDGVAFNFNCNAFATFNFSTVNPLTLAAFNIVTPDFQAVLGDRNQDGFGTFNAGVDHIGQGTSTANLDFTVAGLNFSDLTSSLGGNPSVFFTVDVLGLNGRTGLIGGDPVMTAVPEASTWAMMLLGFVGVGLFGLKRGRGLRLA